MEANASCGATACRWNKYQMVVVVGRDGKVRKGVGAAEMRKERGGSGRDGKGRKGKGEKGKGWELQRLGKGGSGRDGKGKGWKGGGGAEGAVEGVNNKRVYIQIHLLPP
jgi:hypothetical protein